MNHRQTNTPRGYRRRVLGALLAVMALAAAVPLRAQDLTGSTKSGPPLQVVLSWQPDSSVTVTGYNIYRKLLSDVSFPGIPLNGGTPVGPITNCVQFKTIIPMGSADWLAISKAFPDSATGTPLADVCSVALFAKNSRRWRLMQAIAGSRLPAARVMGVAYMDLSGLVAGQQYRYRIRRVGPGGVELASTGADEITVTAGTFDPIPAPANMRIVVGDNKLQVMWDKPGSNRYRAFNLYRSPLPGGPFRRVNLADVSGDISRDLDSALVSPAANGYTDFEQWDSLGNVLPRGVSGVPGTFTGPANGVTYYYKTRLKDILGNEGTESAVKSAAPVDKTAPATPRDVSVTALEAEGHFRIRWPKVLVDVAGRRTNPAYYRVYRYVNPEHPDSNYTLLAGSVPHPVTVPATDSMMLSKTDSANDLRSQCGEKTYYYRVEAIDSSGNISQRSTAVGGSLKDTTKPVNVKDVKAKGEEKFIQISWILNSDCDIERYLIYRALCDYGAWLPCPDSTPKRDPKTGGQTNPNGEGKEGSPPKEGKPKPSDCGGPFALIGSVTHLDAKGMGTPHFDDGTVPPGSPVCYAYLVKAQDKSQNISGKMPIPDASETIVCERLRDKTPPPAAIISGMFARDSAVRVEFIGSPVQDIAAYHMYRAENPFGPYVWVGGVTVVPPPGSGAVLTEPYTGVPAKCEEIPLAVKPYMSAGTIIDKAQPHKAFWYKVLGVDKVGNETSKDSAVPVATFTFTTKRNTAPGISSITAADGPCALVLTWIPAYDASTMRGFVVFRGTAADGPYYQVGNVVRGNTFTDNSVARGTVYWYRVARLNADGTTSNLSDPANAVHP